MKNLLKLFSFIIAGSLLVGCGNSSEEFESDSDSTIGIIDSIPVDSTASGDTAIVIDSIE